MSLSSSQDLEIKKKAWENIAHELTNLTVQNIAGIMNKTASLSRVDKSGSCAWCGDFVKKRRYKTIIDAYNIASAGFNSGENHPLLSFFYAKYDVQINKQQLLVYNIVRSGDHSRAHHLGDSISYTAYLALFKNGVEIERKYFEISKDNVRVINGISGRAGEEFRYLGEVELNLPDPNDLNNQDKIEIMIVTSRSLAAGGMASGLNTAKKIIEIHHEDISYVDQI